ncbi:Interleukin-12 subunit beta [Bagarius yarrelli]|uniref:Interleukin-12 subunit beta n=1 Tax=Bagarius yarrelli TaxID=175774 RepID=A0A556V9J3_BAGYA|nr:Interleukin-12 subunit beta [Bagarius yarrelli]
MDGFHAIASCCLGSSVPLLRNLPPDSPPPPPSFRFNGVNEAVVALEISGNPMEQKTSVELSCGDQFDDAEIRWRKNERSIAAKGNVIKVSIEAMLGGNFTCHSESGELLNHTLVLVSPLDFEKAILLQDHNKEFITCLARNYSGPFHCSWRWDPVRNGVVVFFQALQNSSVINCALDEENAGVTCENLQCPYSEEVTRINLTLLVRNQYRLEEHQRTFYIHDIIKPEKVDIISAENNEFHWEVPKSWNRPCSFFPLRYEVKVMSHRRDCDDTSHDHDGKHPDSFFLNETRYKVSNRRSFTFCVRAQDTFTNHIWSDWSQHSFLFCSELQRDMVNISRASDKEGKTLLLALHLLLSRCFLYGVSVKSVLWVHEEVPSDVVEHDGVLSAVKLTVFSPDHPERLHLNRTEQKDTKS